MSNDHDLDALQAIVDGWHGRFAELPPMTADRGVGAVADYCDIGPRLAYLPDGDDEDDADAWHAVDDMDGDLREHLAAMLNAVGPLLAEVRRLRSTLPARPAAEIGGTEVAMWRAGELLIEACDLGIAIHDQLGLLDYRVDYGTAAAQRKRLQAIRDGEAAARPQPAAEIEIDRSPIISAAETYGRAHAALLEHEEEVRALATPALVPADLWSLLTEHADARDSYDTAFRRIHQAALNPSDSETGDEAEENMQAEMLRSGRANSAIAEWTRANRGGGK